MSAWEDCTTGTIGLPNPNQRSVVKTSGFLQPYIYRYTARVHRDRFLALEGEGMTWMRQPSRQGIALFQCAWNFGEAQHCPRAIRRFVALPPYLVDYVRWDERSDRFSFARQSLQQLSGRTRGYIFQGLQNSSLPPRSAL